LRHADTSNVAASRFGARWLGMPIAGLSDLQRAWVVGAFLRKDQPLVAQRLRQAAKKGCQVLALHAAHDDWLMPVAQQWSLPPDQWADGLAQVAVAVARAAQIDPPGSDLVGGRAAVVSPEADRVAQALLSGERKAVLLGNAAVQHPQASLLQALAEWIGNATGASVGCMGDAGNSVGAQAVGAMPGAGALSAVDMVQGSLKALVLLNVEPALDFGAGAAALRGLGKAHTVIALTPFKTAADVDADVLLPITPFTETAGSFVNAEGRLQSFHGVVKPKGEARPGWKVLRVLGSMLGLPGFEFASSDEVLKEAFPSGQASVNERLDNARPLTLVQTYSTAAGPGPASGSVALQRIAHVPIYDTDAAVRRSPALQATADSRHMVAHVAAGTWRELGLLPGDRVEVTGDDGVAVLPAVLDPTVAAGVVRVPAGRKATASVGPMFGRVRLSRVPGPAGSALAGAGSAVGVAP
jgi:NADH-quinone oxidoreductase subunit G